VTETAGDSHEQPRYEQAMRELEQIITDLQADEVGVDELAERVARGAQLLQLCRDRLRGTELAVQEVVEALASDAATPDPTAPRAEAATPEQPVTPTGPASAPPTPPPPDEPPDGEALF
jgi:exodeoxyribonuclease VII small subunit